MASNLTLGPVLCVSSHLTGCRIRAKKARRIKCNQNPTSRVVSRRLLLGGLASLSWLKNSSKAAEDLDGPDPLYSPLDVSEADTPGQLEEEEEEEKESNPASLLTILEATSSAISLSSAEVLSIFSIGTSIGLGYLAFKYSNEVEKAEKEAMAQLAKAGKLQAQVHVLQADAVNKAQAHEATKKTVSSQSKQIQLERGEVMRLDGELKNVQRELSVTNEKVYRLNSTIESERKEASSSLKEAEGRLKALIEKLTETKSLAQGRGVELKQVKTELAEKLAEVEEAGRRIAQLHDQVRTQEGNVVEAEERIKTLEKARQAAVGDVKELLAKQRNLTFDLKEKEASVSELRSSVNELEDEVATLKNELDESVDRSKSMFGKLFTAEFERDELKKSHELLRVKEESLRKELEEAQSVLFERTDALERAEASSHELGFQLDDKQERIVELEGVVKKEKRACQEKEICLRIVEDDMQSWKDIAGRNAREIEDARSKEQNMLSEIESLKQDVETVGNALAGVEQERDNEHHETDILRARLKNTQEEMESASQRLSSLTKELAQLEAEAARLAGIKEQLDVVKGEAAMFQEKLVVAEHESQELQTAQAKLREAEANMRAMREEISAVQSGSRGELRKVKMQLAASQSEVKELKNAISIMKQEASKLMKDLETSRMGDVSSAPKEEEGADNSDGIDGGAEGISKELFVTKETIPSVGKEDAIRMVAKVRADAVQWVEELEDSAHTAISDAKQAARRSEKAAIQGLMAATSAEGKVERLQESLDKANEEISHKDDQIAQLKSEISGLNDDATSMEDDKADE